MAQIAIWGIWPRRQSKSPFGGYGPNSESVQNLRYSMCGVACSRRPWWCNLHGGNGGVVYKEVYAMVWVVWVPYIIVCVYVSCMWCVCLSLCVGGVASFVFVLRFCLCAFSFVLCVDCWMCFVKKSKNRFVKTVQITKMPKSEITWNNMK